MRQKVLDFIKGRHFVFAVYYIVAIVFGIQKFILGPHRYNNYLIFKGVYTHTIQQQNLYLEYPALYFDKNHYGIIFSAIIAPFTLLPDWLGLILWNVINVSLFLYSIIRLPFSEKQKITVLWLCVLATGTSMNGFQFNTALAGLLILSACYIYENKEAKSVWMILIGLFVKLYGIVGLSSFFFVKNKKRFLWAMSIGAVALLLFPILYTSVHFNFQSYLDWYHELLIKNQKNEMMDGLQDVSIMGFFRRFLGTSNISNWLFLAVGLPIFGAPYLRVRHYSNRAFQLLILCSTLLFVVLFSSGSEAATYILAEAGVMIWYCMQKKKTFTVILLLILVLIFSSVGSTDLFPHHLRDEYLLKRSIKAVPCFLVWLRISYELLFCDFKEQYQYVDLEQGRIKARRSAVLEHQLRTSLK